MRIILNGHKRLNSILNEHSHFPGTAFFRVEKTLKGNLDLITSPSPSVKIQIMGKFA